MQSSITIALVLVAVAVAIPSEFVPEDALEQYTTTDSDYEHARKTVQSLMQTGKADKQCRDLATASKKAVEDDVKADQKILDALPTGDSCKNEGQGLVSSSQKSLAQAKSDEDGAKKKLDKAKAANVDFGSIPYNQLTPGQCGTFFNHANYKKAVDVQNKAKSAHEKAKGAHAAAQKAYNDAAAAAAKGKLECLCRAKKAHDKGWKEVKATKANAGLDWKTAHNVLCVLDGTPASKCAVPAQPTINAPKLNAEAAKLNGSTCKDGLCYKAPITKYVTNGATGQQVKCGSDSCGKMVGAFYPTQSGLQSVIYKPDPFTFTNQQCASRFPGSHWCTPQEVRGYTKADFDAMRKLPKVGSTFPNHNPSLTFACGKWMPYCGYGAAYAGRGIKPCWFFEGAVDYGNGKWSNTKPNGNFKPTYQGGMVACCKGKRAPVRL
jgi:hypothetical protein